MKIKLSQVFRERAFSKDNECLCKSKQSKGNNARNSHNFFINQEEGRDIKSLSTTSHKEVIDSQRKLLLDEAKKECGTPEFQKTFSYVSGSPLKSHFYKESILLSKGIEASNIDKFNINQENALEEELVKKNVEDIQSKETLKEETCLNYYLDNLTFKKPFEINPNYTKKPFEPLKPRRTTKQMEFQIPFI